MKSLVMSGNEKMCTRNFKNEPKYFKSLINKNVEILTSNDVTHVGSVYVVDPLSETFVIVDNKSGKQNVSIVLGHAIKSVKLCGETKGTSTELPEDNLSNTDAENVEKRKANIKAWLSKHLIHVEEDGLSLKLGDDLIIDPPYDKEHCISGNTIILQRIQDILAKMPNNS